jgi:hypothetical protein
METNLLIPTIRFEECKEGEAVAAINVECLRGDNLAVVLPLKCLMNSLQAQEVWFEMTEQLSSKDNKRNEER